MKQYEGRLPLNHLDVYRLADSDEDLGWDEIFYGDAVIGCRMGTSNCRRFTSRTFSD